MTGRGVGVSGDTWGFFTTIQARARAEGNRTSGTGTRKQKCKSQTQGQVGHGRPSAKTQRQEASGPRERDYGEGAVTWPKKKEDTKQRTY